MIYIYVWVRIKESGSRTSENVFRELALVFVVQRTLLKPRYCLFQQYLKYYFTSRHRALLYEPRDLRAGVSREGVDTGEEFGTPSVRYTYCWR